MPCTHKNKHKYIKSAVWKFRHVTFNEYNNHGAGIQHAEATEYNNINEDSRRVRYETPSSTQDIKDRQGDEQQKIEEESKYKKTILEEGIPNTKPVRGDVIRVNYTSTLSDGSRMDNTTRAI